jgi:hypothetical protein
MARTRNTMNNNKDGIQLTQISDTLDQIMRLLALNLVKEMELQKDQILFLSRSGLQPKQIAEILSTTSHIVSVVLHSSKKGKKSSAAIEAAEPESLGEGNEKQQEQVSG